MTYNDFLFYFIVALSRR